MFQDIAPLTFTNAFATPTPKDTDFACLFKKGKPLLKRQGDSMVIPTYGDLKGLIPGSLHRATYLCAVSGTSAFSFGTSQEIEAENGLDLDNLEGYSLETIRVFRTMTPSWHGFLGVTAHHLHTWYSQNQFCGRCGHPMAPSTTERALGCTHCGLTEYPKICPAIIVGVKDGNRLLLTKYANRAFANYALIAGFCEIGETVEETVHREVLEEVGVHVKNLTYYKSQPWGFSQSLLFGFFAELDGDKAITLDRQELAIGQWFEREDIPTNPDNALSLTYEMMQAFKTGQIL